MDERPDGTFSGAVDLESDPRDFAITIAEVTNPLSANWKQQAHGGYLPAIALQESPSVQFVATIPGDSLLRVSCTLQLKAIHC